jgi:Zn finger protein HypA/HybF involved in hydrogenase expression
MSQAQPGPAQPYKPATPSSKPAQPSSTQVMSNCPQCSASLAVLRIIPGKAGAEYWTMRCTKCGGIHLDIVKADSPDATVDSSDVFA